jgi:WD40 repeat protein
MFPRVPQLRCAGVSNHSGILTHIRTESTVFSIAFLHDSICVVSGSSDQSVCIWDALTGKQVQKLDGHMGSVNSVAFSHDSTCVVSGSVNQSVRI